MFQGLKKFFVTIPLFVWTAVACNPELSVRDVDVILIEQDESPADDGGDPLTSDTSGDGDNFLGDTDEDSGDDGGDAPPDGGDPVQGDGDVYLGDGDDGGDPGGEGDAYPGDEDGDLGDGEPDLPPTDTDPGPILVDLTITFMGTGTGNVSLDTTPVQSCSSTCTVSVERDVLTSLSAFADEDSWFEGYSGTLCGGRRACSVKITEASSVTISFTPEPNRIFLSSQTSSGNLGGLSGADNFCSDLAAGAGLGGTWIALLPNATLTGMGRLAGVRGWIRVDGEPVMNEPSSRIWYPVRLDEYGVDLGDVKVWAPPSYTDRSCAEWTSENGTDQGNQYSAVRAYNYSSGGGGYACSNFAHVFCAQIDRDVPINPTFERGRSVFVSNATWTSGGGRSSADALCASEAADAGLVGSFVAFLGEDGEADTERLTEGLPWVRMDGMIFSDTVTALTTEGPTDIALPFTAQNLGMGFTTLRGGGFANTAATTCENWTSSTTGFSPACFYTWNAEIRCLSYACSSAMRLLCLEQ